MSPAGRSSAIPPEIMARMQEWRSEGLSLPAIAKRLNDEGTPTPGGGKAWYPQSVRQAIAAAERRGSKFTLTFTFLGADEVTFARWANVLARLVRVMVLGKANVTVTHEGASTDVLNAARDAGDWPWSP